jgi:molybdenum storage protein
MAEIVKRGPGHRAHIKSRFMRESLLNTELIRSTGSETELQLLPDVNVVALGGQSIIDRGREALFPVVDEIVAARKKYKIVVGVGGGTRVRHTYHICLDLGIPTGGMAMVAGGVDEQNIRMVQCLMAKHKGITLNKDHFLDLPLWLESGMIPIMIGMPPYHFWEPPTGEDRLPANGEDLGLFLLSEVLGARSMVFLKDVDGIYTDNPKTNPAARLIPRVGARELLEMDLPDMPIERVVLEAMLNARHTHRFYVINGLKKGLLAQALAGRNVGTVVTVEPPSGTSGAGRERRK